MPSLVVHQAVATITREGSDKAADELGGQSYYNAPISVDGEPRGVLFGELRTLRVYEGDDGATWDRQGIATFRFSPRDSIVIAGVVTYPAGQMHSTNGKPFWRVITGGTGDFAGARGEVESVRSEDGTFTHTLNLL